MIIACPTCAAPFQVLDDQIAPLLQVACPGCGFRMILDFEAANDPSLVDPGTQMATGYRSESDYRSAAAGGVTTTTPPRETPAASPRATPKAPPAAPPKSPPAPATRATTPKAPPAAPPKSPPAPPARSAAVPPPPQHKSKKTLIASPGMMAAVPKAPPAKAARSQETAAPLGEVDAGASLRREGPTGGAPAPHAPAENAAPGWPTEAQTPPATTAEDDTPSEEIIPPAQQGGALKASPAPAPAGRSGFQTFLVWTLLTLVVIVGAVWLSAFNATGNPDPRPFIQSTLLPALQSKLGGLLGG